MSRQFNGAIFPVNPQAAAIHSLKCYPSVAAIPDPVDLAVVMVPSRSCSASTRPACGVKGFVVITAGFAETGEEGAALERRLRDKVRAAGVRMIGPNCMGVINTDPEVRLDATFAPHGRAPGVGRLRQPVGRAGGGDPERRAGPRASASPSSSPWATRPTSPATT